MDNKLKDAKFYVKKSSLLLFCYISSSFFFFLFIAQPVLHGELDLKFYSDTKVYEEIYLNEPLKPSNLIANNSNLIGPILIITIFGNNYFLIYIFNVLLLLYSYKLIIKSYSIKETMFIFLLIINPYIFTGLLSVNKEILSVFGISYFLYYLRKPSLYKLLFILLLSLLIRWQYLVFFIVIMLLNSRINIFYNRRLLTAFLLVFFISLIYPIISRLYFESINLTSFYHIIRQGDQGSGIFAVFTNLQNNYVYFLVFPLKVAQVFFGYLTKIRYFFNFDYTLYILQSFAYLVLLYYFIKRKLQLNNDLVYYALIYAGIFALMPFVVPRYFLPVYILLSVCISIERDDIVQN